MQDKEVAFLNNMFRNGKLKFVLNEELLDLKSIKCFRDGFIFSLQETKQESSDEKEQDENKKKFLDLADMLKNFALSLEEFYKTL